MSYDQGAGTSNVIQQLLLDPGFTLGIKIAERLHPSADANLLPKTIRLVTANGICNLSNFVVPKVNFVRRIGFFEANMAYRSAKIRHTFARPVNQLASSRHAGAANEPS
jgi:hypothetical protein